MKQKVVIIGAGIGGLAAANMLAKAGYEVSVYEKNAQAGGRAGLHKAKGFTFDTGPSWYLMPEIFDHYFELLGEKATDYYRLEKLQPGYQIFFEGNSEPLKVTANKTKDKRSFESFERGSGAVLDRYIDQAEKTYRLATKYFLYNNFNNPRNVITPEVAKLTPQMLTLAGTSLHRYVQKYFSDSRLQQALEYAMVFLGTSPFDAPALYSLMSYIDFKQGVFYPQGGMYKIIEALVLIGKKLGVQYHPNANVTHIKTTNGHASGIQVNGSFVPADIIISNADLHHTETALLGKSHRSYPEGYWQKKTAAPSALLMYLGVKGTLPKLEHHNLYFVKEWDKNFTDIFEHKKWPDPASLYVSMPSKTDDTVAPKGHENVFILVPTAANERITPKQLEAYADRYLDQFAIAANIPDFKKRIVYKKLVGPADFAQQFNSWHGTALGLAHTLRQSAVFRPKITSKKVDNLYYVGGNTLPGIGLPMCLISAELVYKKLTGDNSAGPLKSL